MNPLAFLVFLRARPTLPRAGVLLVTALAVPLAGQVPERGSVRVTGRVSVNSSGAQGNGPSVDSSISTDGRYVAFRSSAGNLVSGDTNGFYDVFVRDRPSGTTERVSVHSLGTQGNGSSDAPSISADGRHVAFASTSGNLVSGDTNGSRDVFVHDRWTGTTERVSVDSLGTQGNDSSGAPSISADGRYVAFVGDATNLVTGDTNGFSDVFVHDRSSGTTERVSVASLGAQGNLTSETASISADGRYVAFESRATNLVGGDTNGCHDVFVRDRWNGTTERVSVDSVGMQANNVCTWPSISADGRYVAFEGSATNLVGGDTNGAFDVFMRDRSNGTTERVSVDSFGTQANGSCLRPSITADGSYVAFQSLASNLVSGDTNGFYDVFVRDRSNGTTERVSVHSSGTQANDGSVWPPSISVDGRYAAFASFATNLVSGDTNGAADVFVHDRVHLPPIRRL